MISCLITINGGMRAMNHFKPSRAGDLTNLMNRVEAMFEKEFGGKCAIGVCFTLPPDYDDAHFVTNIPRSDGIRLFAGAAEKMQARVN